MYRLARTAAFILGTALSHRPLQPPPDVLTEWNVVLAVDHRRRTGDGSVRRRFDGARPRGRAPGHA